MDIEERKAKGELVKLPNVKLEKLIYTIRDKQVMVDRDLAELYQVETRVLNQAVKRNIERFPEEFMFKLSDDEFDILRSQIVISKKEDGRGGTRYLPHVFTEQGVAMLSAVLKSDVAVEVSIGIMNAFVEMRRFLVNNQFLIERMNGMELRQLQYQDESNTKFDKIFEYMSSQPEITQKIFFKGQIFDAFALLVEIIRKAEKNIVLIDGYSDVETLNILCKKSDGVNVDIITSKNGLLSAKDITKFNKQYPKLKVVISDEFHDRFIILDEKEAYHIGASLKDAGRKCFAITKLEDEKMVQDLIGRINLIVI